MQLNGNLSEESFPGLLQSIYARRDAAGVLDILHEPVKKRFFFKDGVPVASTSNVLGEVLGRLLMDEGIITQDDYESSLEKVINEKRRHGEVLISMGLITKDRLEEFLRMQLKRRVLNIFSWEEGTYRYVKAESLPEGLSLMPMHPGRLILEGISLGFYPAGRIRDDLSPYLDRQMVYDAATLETYGFEDMELNLQEQRFLSRFDGTATLREVLDTSDLLRHRAVAIALTSVMTGMVKGTDEISGAAASDVVEAAPETRMGAELMFMKAKSALVSGRFEEAADILTQITELNPVEAEYWAYLGWAVFCSDPSRTEEAERILKDAIDLNNDLDRAWFFLGKVFLSKGDDQWARRAFSTAVQKNPWLLSALAELKQMDIAASSTGAVGAPSRTYPEGFAFSMDPFTQSASENLLVDTASQQDALDSLARSIKKRSGPALLTGERGSGKTTVMLELLRRLSNEKVLCILILEPPARELDLIRAINAEAGSPIDSTSIKEQLLSLGMRLSQNKIQGGHSVIIIDEAHTLTPGCMKLIQYLTRLKTLQVVLSSEPSILATLEEKDFTELASKISTSASLEPMTRDETREFILKRLTVAAGLDYTGPEGAPFAVDESLLSELYESSSGLPATTCRHAAAALAAGSGITARGAHAVAGAAKVAENAAVNAAEPDIDTGFGAQNFDFGADETHEGTQPLETEAGAGPDAPDIASAETAGGAAADWLEFDGESSADSAAGVAAETPEHAEPTESEPLTDPTGQGDFELTGSDFFAHSDAGQTEPGAAGEETAGAGDEEARWLSGTNATAAAEAFLDSTPPVDLSGVGISDDLSPTDTFFDAEAPGGAPYSPDEMTVSTPAAESHTAEGFEPASSEPWAEANIGAEEPAPSTPSLELETTAESAASFEPGPSGLEATAPSFDSAEQLLDTDAGAGAAAAAAAAAAAKVSTPSRADAQQAAEPAVEKIKKPRSLIRLLVWVIVMLIAGLVVGSAIGVLMHGQLETILGGADAVVAQNDTRAASHPSSAPETITRRAS